MDHLLVRAERRSVSRLFSSGAERRSVSEPSSSESREEVSCKLKIVNCKLPICMAPLTPPQFSGRLTRHSIMLKLIKIV